MMKWNSTFLNLLRITSDVILGSDQSFIPVGKQQDTNRPSMTYPDFLFPPHCRPLPPSTCFLFLTYCIDSKKLSSDQKQFQDHNKCLFFIHVTTSMSPGNASGQLSSLVMAKQYISVSRNTTTNPMAEEEFSGDPTSTEKCSHPKRISVTSI